MRRAWLILAALLCPPAAQACNVPVFRYALERWKPDTHDVLVFHRGKLSGAAKNAVELLKKYGQGETIPSNLELTLVDLDTKPDDADVVKMYEKLGKPELPALVVRFKNLERQMVTAWSGRLTEETARAVAESPVRQKLGRRLASGETAVWLFLESGDAKKDAAARDLLLKELNRLTPTLKLPELTESPEDRLNPKGPPLRISFSILSVKRDDSAEEVLRMTLLRSEDDIEQNKEPMAFPIFGRGRTLGALIGAGITAENIGDGCKMLVAPCSCKIKVQSPGCDLLLSTDWDGALDSQPVTETPRTPNPPSKTTDPITIALPKTTASEPRKAAALEPEQAEEIVPTRLVLGGIGLASLMVLMTGFWLLRSRASA